MVCELQQNSVSVAGKFLRTPHEFQQSSGPKGSRSAIYRMGCENLGVRGGLGGVREKKAIRDGLESRSVFKLPAPNHTIAPPCTKMGLDQDGRVASTVRVLSPTWLAMAMGRCGIRTGDDSLDAHHAPRRSKWRNRLLSPIAPQ